MRLRQPVHGWRQLAARDAAPKRACSASLRLNTSMGACASVRRSPLSKVALHERRAYQRAVAQGAQRQHRQPRHGWGRPSRRPSRGLARRQVGRMVLVLHMDVEGDGLPLGRLRHGGGTRWPASRHSRQSPAAWCCAARRQWWPARRPAQRHLARMAVQRLPGLGGRVGRGAAQFSTWPTRSSSSLMRCDTAERDMQHGRPRSKLPSSITVAKALSWAESSCMGG